LLSQAAVKHAQEFMKLQQAEEACNNKLEELKVARWEAHQLKLNVTCIHTS